MHGLKHTPFYCSYPPLYTFSLLLGTKKASSKSYSSFSIDSFTYRKISDDAFCEEFVNLSINY